MNTFELMVAKDELVCTIHEMVGLEFDLKKHEHELELLERKIERKQKLHHEKKLKLAQLSRDVYSHDNDIVSILMQLKERDAYALLSYGHTLFIICDNITSSPKIGLPTLYDNWSIINENQCHILQTMDMVRYKHLTYVNSDNKVIDYSVMYLNPEYTINFDNGFYKITKN